MTSETALAAYLEKPTRGRRDDLIAASWYLCVRGAKKFHRAGVERADLTQVGAVGLLKAVNGYNPQLRTPFEAFAWLLIVGELMHYVRDHEHSVRIPRPLRALEKRYAVMNEKLAARLGRTPRPADLAAELQIDERLVDEIRMLRRGGAAVSLEAYTGSPTGELPARAGGLGLDERLALRAAIAGLAERERFAVLGSFAVGLSQAELGRRLGLSQSQVSKLLKKALGKIHGRLA
jgi:RNA polymerase sigma-B factor